MNKLLTRIAVLAVGAGLAVAVGVASSKGAEVAEATSTEYTLTITINDFTTKSYADNNKVHTSAAKNADETKVYDVDWESNQFMNSSGVIQGQKTNGYIQNVTDLGTIKSVTIDATANNFNPVAYGTAYGACESSEVGGGFFKISVNGTAAAKANSITIVFEAQDKSPLASIKVSTAPAKVTYVDEEFFNTAGMVVTAVYEDGTEADVTAKATVVDLDKPLTAGLTSKTISYTEGGITKTVDQPITVTANPNKHVYKAISAPEAGSFVIAYTLVSEEEGTATYAALPELSSNRLNYRQVEVNTDGDVLTGNAAYVWTVAAVTVGETTYYTIYNASAEKYLSSGQNNTNTIALVDAIDEEKKTEYWNIENKTVTTAAGEVTQLVIEAPFKTYVENEETKLSESRFVSYNPGYGFACYKANSSTAKLVNLCKDNGVAPSSDPEPTPTPEPEPAKKGCRGEIVTTSIILSTLALAGVTLLSIKKRKED